MSTLRLFEPTLGDIFDGVLTLELPKKAIAASKRLAIE